MKLFYTIIFLFSSFCASSQHSTTRLIPDSFIYKYTLNDTRLLGLPKIHDGVDSFELRIWSSSITNYNHLVILRYSKTNWRLENIKFWTRIDTNEREIDSSIIAPLKTKLSLDKILQSLDKLQIESLPTQHGIPGFRSSWEDGVSYTIELSKQNYYKIIWYSNPDKYSDPFNQKVTELIRFSTDNQFGHYGKEQRPIISATYDYAIPK